MVSASEPLKIATPTILRQHRNGYWLTADNPDGNTQGHIKCEVNLAGKLILQTVDGNADTDGVVKRMCVNHDLEQAEAQPWITAFIDNMSRRRILTTSHTITHQPLTVVGDADHAFPEHVSIEVTESCNLRCSFCYLAAGPDKRDRLEFHEVLRLLDDMKSHGLTSVSLTGGEFFLHPQAIQILRYACEEFPSVGLLTNGTAFSEKAFDVLEHYKDRVTVSISIDSAKANFHNSVRQGKRAFEKSTEAIRELAQRGILVRMSSVIVEETMWEIHELADLAISLGAKAFSFNFVEGFGRGQMVKGIDKTSLSEEYRQYVSDVLTRYRKIIPIVAGENRGEERHNCGAGISSVSIGADGTVRPCPMFPKSARFENIKNKDLQAILDSPIHRILEKIPAPSEENGCSRKCPHFSDCRNCYLRGLNINAHRKPYQYCNWIITNGLEELIDLVRPKPVPVKITRRPDTHA